MDRRSFFKMITTGVVIAHIPGKHPPIEGAGYYVSLHTTNRVYDTQHVSDISGLITFKESVTRWGIVDQFTVTAPNGSVYVGKLEPPLFLDSATTPKVTFSIIED